MSCCLVFSLGKSGKKEKKTEKLPEELHACPRSTGSFMRLTAMMSAAIHADPSTSPFSGPPYLFLGQMWLRLTA